MNSANSILLLIFLAVTAIIPQDRLDEQLTKAKTMYFHEEYFNSITELKRLIFFDNKKQFSYTANELIGECYKKGAKLTEALSYFTRAEIATTKPEEVYNCRINMIKINILRRTTGRALSLLDALEKRRLITGEGGHIFFQMNGIRHRINLGENLKKTD
jgi:hypothetical protein